MKKQTFILTSVLIAVCFIARAQVQQVLLLEKPGWHDARATIHPAITANFQSLYPNAHDEAWAQIKTGFTVDFISDGVSCKAFLNKKGKPTGTIRNLTESGLPPGVQKQIRSLEGCFTFGSIKEVTTELGTVYLVTIIGADTWKVMRVAGNEMDVYEEHKKS